MMSSYTVFYLTLSLLAVGKCNGISSPIQPFTTYEYSTELQADVADLWWSTNETQQDIIFELHIKTTGWIAFGISPGISLYTILFFIYIALSFILSR